MLILALIGRKEKLTQKHENFSEVLKNKKLLGKIKSRPEINEETQPYTHMHTHVHVHMPTHTDTKVKRFKNTCVLIK